MKRRRLLLAVTGAPLLGVTLTACLGEPTPKSAPQQRPDADIKVRWRAVRGERALLALHRAAVTAHPALAERLAPLTAHHEEHLAVLEADGPLPFGADGIAGAGSSTDGAGSAGVLADPPAPSAPPDPAAALSAIAEAERAAGQDRLADCLAAAGPRLAAVLASIAAAEGAHAVVMETT